MQNKYIFALSKCETEVQWVFDDTAARTVVCDRASESESQAFAPLEPPVLYAITSYSHVYTTFIRAIIKRYILWLG